MIELTTQDVAITAGVGLLAGVLGGLLGIGGSIILIPGMALAFGSANPESQHLFQASAMMVNVEIGRAHV